MSRMEDLRRQGARALTPLFLLGALLTGGASLEGEALQAGYFALSGVLLAGLFALSPGWLRGAVVPVLLFAAVLALMLVAQILPLSADLTAGLPARPEAREVLAALGQAPEVTTLSLAPDATLAGLLAFLAPLAGFCLVAALKWTRGAGVLKWTIPAFGAASAMLGIAQVILGKAEPSLYLYDFTTRGLPVGVFANPNHQASFLLMCLPFTGVLAAGLRRDWEGSDAEMAQAAYVALSGLLIAAGILGAGSVAGYLLLLPVAGFTLAIFLSGRAPSGSGGLAGLALLPLILGLAALIIFSSPRLPGLGVTSLEDGPGSRIAINRISAGMLADHWQAGAGLGTYADLYRLEEDPQTVSSAYVAHAHNDYFEWAIETGLAGMILLAAFLIWWAARFAGLWSGGARDAFRLRRAASVACLVPILHSLVDYPLRTPAIAAFAGICLALMIVPRGRQEAPLAGAEGEERAVRSVEI